MKDKTHGSDKPPFIILGSVDLVFSKHQTNDSSILIRNDRAAVAFGNELSSEASLEGTDSPEKYISLLESIT